MKENNIIPDDFKKTELGPLPEEWRVVKAIDYCDFERGTEPGSDSYNRQGDGIPFIRVGNIAAGIQELVFTNSNNLRLCNKEDILMSFDGSPGVVVKGFRGAYSSGIRKVVSKMPYLDKTFLFYVLKTKSVQDVVEKYTTGMTIKHASKSLSHIQIPLPPLPEQQKISTVLSTVQELKERTEDVIKATKELKKSIMKHLFTYGPVPLEEAENVPLKETEIGMVPEGWEVKPLVDIATLQRGKDLPKRKQIPGPYPIVGSSGIIGYHNKKVCVGPGVVTGRSGSIGKLIYVEEDYWPHNTGLYVKNFHENNPKFIYYLLHLLDFKRFATGVSVPTLNRNFIHSSLLPVPPITLQQKIANILSSVDRKIEVEENKKKALDDLFKTLLHDLMTAKIRINNLEVEV